MIGLGEPNATAAPSTYQDWLDCFARMKEMPLSANGEFAVLANGSFSGTQAMRAALERQMVETVNAVLNRSVKRFVRDLNERLAFHELSQMDLLFQRFKRDVERILFFQKLSFLPEEFREELYGSIVGQMTGFWNDTVAFLRRQAMESADSDLEDALYLIRRIRLFSQQG